MKACRSSEANKLSERLEKHPELRRRVEQLLDLCEDRADDLQNADEAERRVIEELRTLGHEVLEDWAMGQVERSCEVLDRTAGVWREGKKNSAGTACSGTSRSRSRSTVKGPGGDDR
jgi:predicted ribosome quality control (RQC) complex YloA/Tae2 family protein